MLCSIDIDYLTGSISAIEKILGYSTVYVGVASKDPISNIAIESVGSAAKPALSFEHLSEQ